MASNLLEMASNLLEMASNLVEMAQNERSTIGENKRTQNKGHGVIRISLKGRFTLFSSCIPNEVLSLHV